jgi:hypothetical protein
MAYALLTLESPGRRPGPDAGQPGAVVDGPFAEAREMLGEILLLRPAKDRHV